MTLEIQQDRSLKRLNTLGLDARAEHFVHVANEDELREALELAAGHNWPVTVLGGGSNLVLSGDVPGLVIHMGITGIGFEGEMVEAGAGEPWHQLVMAAIGQGLSGIENLSLIPGSAGAAPIQNIGAYGAELTDVFDSLVAIDRHSLETLQLSRADCRFGYRDSVFKHALRDRVVIVRIRLKLSETFSPNLRYEALREALDASPGPLCASTVSEAVCNIRRSKLPDPAKTGNVGSFFKNPVVPQAQLDALQHRYSALPCWQTEAGVKVSAGWLIEQCGLKGEAIGGAAISPGHALVIINRGEATGEDVMTLAGLVQSRVEARFGIRLEIEPVVR